MPSACVSKPRGAREVTRNIFFDASQKIYSSLRHEKKNGVGPFEFRAMDY